MAKPTIYFQSFNAGTFPASRTTNRWTEETEIGTKLTGDAISAAVGINLGALTNLQSSNEFDILITHSAINPVTDVKFYFQQTTNNRTGGTGFTHTADAAGAANDFAELLGWGDSDDGAGNYYGMTMRQYHESTPTLLKTGVVDALASAKPLTNNGKFFGGIAGIGNSPTGEEDWIMPFSNYKNNDSACVSLKLNVPDIDTAGIRQCSFTCRLTYSF